MFVNSRLLKRSEWHLQVDEEVLDIMTKLVQTAELKGKIDDPVPATRRAEEGVEILNAIEMEEFSAAQVAKQWNIPVSIVNELIRLEKMRLAQHEELVEMQAELQEKFSGGTFNITNTGMH